MMLPLTRLWPLLRCGAAAGTAAGGSPTTTSTEEEEEEDDAEDEAEDGGERPALPAEAPGSPAPSAAEARGFFRGGGEAPPASESEEEEAEARVSSPREAVVGAGGARRGPGEAGAGSGERSGEPSGAGPRGRASPSPRAARSAAGGAPGPRGRRRGARGPPRGWAPARAAAAAGGGGGSGRLGRLGARWLRSAPWCVDSSPSCCLMESRRSRHRKCLYCPPHSLPVAVHFSRFASFGGLIKGAFPDFQPPGPPLIDRLDQLVAAAALCGGRSH
ncbi:translation initiation factor IF-2-like [Canis lupus dingo]|uniref:translation initiation factor IF-2-like n=1 Tax=Canis lupus dingo TaxID=286419 RepID=UPI0020C481CB|nr:translation initiation factor IF-2-like [Canis lupus dingo]